MLNLVKINCMAQLDLQNPGQTPAEKKKMHPVKKFFRRVLLFFIVLFFMVGLGDYLYVTHTIKENASIQEHLFNLQLVTVSFLRLMKVF